MSRRNPGAAPHSLRASLAYLVAVRLVLNTAHRLAYPFLPAISRGLGVSLTQGGLLLSARSLAGLATPLVVATAGRGERRRRMLAVGLALFIVGAAVTAATGVYAGALVGFALFGLAKPLFDISAQAYVADRTPYRGRARYIALLETTWALALLVGAPAAGWLIARLGWEAPFWAVAALALVALAILPWAIDRDPAREAGSPAARLRFDRSAVLLLSAIFLLMFSAEVSFVVFGAWLEDHFGLSLVALGGAATAVAVAELAGEGASFAFTDRLGPRRSVSIGLVICIASFASLGTVSGRLGWGLAALVLAFFGFEFAIVSALPLATEVAPAARARFLALLVVALSASRAVAAAVAPPLFSWGGFAANSTASATAGALALVMLFGVREQPSAGPPPTGVPL
jgi:predicted MFS family arabinose efflux permease